MGVRDKERAWTNSGKREKEGENAELECGCALCLQGCVHPLYRSQREIKREREGGERERERERVFIFKRNDGCLGTF